MVIFASNPPQVIQKHKAKQEADAIAAEREEDIAPEEGTAAKVVTVKGEASAGEEGSDAEDSKGGDASAGGHKQRKPQKGKAALVQVYIFDLPVNQKRLGFAEVRATLSIVTILLYLLTYGAPKKKRPSALPQKEHLLFN